MADCGPGVIKPTSGLLNSKRSRLQEELGVDEEEEEEEKEDAVPVVDQSVALEPKEEQPSTTSTSTSTSSTTSTTTTTEATTSTTSTTEIPATTYRRRLTSPASTTPSTTSTTTTTTTTTEEAAADPSSSTHALFDRTPWQPGVPREPIEQNVRHPVTVDLPHPIIPWTGPTMAPRPVNVTAEAGVQEPQPEMAEEEYVVEYVEEESQEEPSGEEEEGEEQVDEGEEEEEDGDRLPTNVKIDRTIDVGWNDQWDSSTERAAATTTKFSFLQWFNERLTNGSGAGSSSSSSSSKSNSAPATRATPTPTPTTARTRFFTLRPTAISYSGVQAVTRPRPSALDDDAVAAAASVPAPFQIQTVLSVVSDSKNREKTG